MAKSKKGSVSVSVADGRLRLRWQGLDAQGKQKRFFLPFDASNETNRLAADRLARKIELDIASSNFDPSLRKYKVGTDRQDSLSISQLIDSFVYAKITADQSSSHERYRTLKNHLLKCFREMPVDGCDEKKAIAFLRYLQDSEMSGATINLYLTLVRSVWNWGIKKGLIQVNPWLDMSVATEPNQPAKPFTREEIQKILAAFKGDYYEDFVRFMFGLGCRPGEAVALQWTAINDDCSEVWIGKAWDSKGRRVKSTKTNETRTVPVSPSIQSMLQELRRQSKSELVLPAPKGGYIDSKNFLKRHWKPLLEKAEVEYRSPYKTRHTRWSHEIAGGMDVATAARYAGNRPRTMMDRYFGATGSFWNRTARSTIAGSKRRSRPFPP